MRSIKEINLTCVSFIIFGLVISSIPAKEYLESRQSKTWPVVKGNIIVSRIHESLHRRYSAKIKYSYMINGKKYIGDRVRFGWNKTGVREAVADIKNKYSSGSIVKVHYNPKEPSRSVLEPLLNIPLDFISIFDMSIWIIIPGPGCFVFGIIILIYRKKLIE